jgi:hypothetical protein
MTSIIEAKQAESRQAESRQSYGISASVFGGAPGAITGCTSIDSDRNDNGFLVCATGQNLGAGLHDSTAIAVYNLLQCLGVQRGKANLVGHGADGIIVTGSGDEISTYDKCIGLFNRSYWEPYLNQLRGKVSSLSLWACHPGTGQIGADFLFMLAQVVNVPVAGPTGFIYCGGGYPDLWLEPNSVWQVATPTNKPNPIAAPTPYFQDLIMDIKLTENGQIMTMPLATVISVKYTPGKKLETPSTFSMADDKARDLVQLIRFDAPFQPGGIPAAIVTGRLSIIFERDGQRQEREFRIYNNRLLQDVVAPQTYYHVTEGFTQAFAIP